MSRKDSSRGVIKPLIIIGIIAVSLICWVIIGSLRTLPYFNKKQIAAEEVNPSSSPAPKMVKVDGLKLMEEAGLRASANIDWSMLYGSTETERSVISAAIIEASQTYKVNADLLRAIIMAESVFDDEAVSSRGARGLMQLMPGTALEVGVKDPFDPRENILGGAAYFSGLLEQFNGDVRLSLAAYNSGAQRIKDSNMSIPPTVVPYVDRVLSYYKFFGGKELLE